MNNLNNNSIGSLSTVLSKISDPQLCESVVKRWMSENNIEPKEKFPFKLKRTETLYAYPSEFLFIKGEGRGCKIHLLLPSGIKVIPYSISLGEMEDLVCNHSIRRVHKSYIVNLSNALLYDSANNYLKLISDHSIPVSKMLNSNMNSILNEINKIGMLALLYYSSYVLQVA